MRSLAKISKHDYYVLPPGSEAVRLSEYWVQGNAYGRNRILPSCPESLCRTEDEKLQRLFL